MKSVELPRGLGTVTPITAAEVCDWIVANKAPSDHAHILGNLNLHALYLTLEEGPVATMTRASDVVLIDGWPILQLARLSASSNSRPTSRERVGSTDWLEELIRRDPDLRVVAVGGTPATAEGMRTHVVERASRLAWRAFDGYEFRERSEAAEGDLESALEQAQLVLVGLGMPRQESWILDHLHYLNRDAVIANVGGCFDYFAGTQRLAPRWMGALGIEWLFRLAHSPRRLAGRYLVEPLLLVGRLSRRPRPATTASAQSTPGTDA
ncbi:WecB/TagA/CpsF family glycosyltransferase [Microbacterium proteolyticum]|uniref:WecB/TagA/CpsF family glycosyltransferase n=1 Tax=Microbacterium proteolyticum TaxID=1572644 RepID=UPI0035C04ABB